MFGGDANAAEMEGMTPEDRRQMRRDRNRQVLGGLAGIAGGAAGGALLGSALGPVGTVLGGIVGGIVGEEAVKNLSDPIIDGIGDFAGKAIAEADVTAYVDEVLANYDAAATNDDKLAIVMEEFYIASFGNSVEPYNNYRRTGYPVLGESVITNTDFPRSFFIPSSEINSNDNPDLEQKKLGDRVFWDTNPEDFID